MEDIQITDNSYFVDERGDSVFDIFEASPMVGQVNIATMSKGVVKAFHRHHNQDDYFTCIEGRVLIIMFVPGELGSDRIFERVVIGGKKPQVVKIPAGVFHGFKALDDNTKVLYYTTNKYDPKRPDEYRLEWDYFGKEAWDIRNF